MPCNSDYMNPSNEEVDLSKVYSLLDEISTSKLDKSNYNGYHPKAYGLSSKDKLDKAVAKLCNILKKIDVKNYSLEMQIWWRDHQIADKNRKNL